MPKSFTTRYDNLSNALWSDVGVGVAFDPRTSASPALIKFKGIWDTGATHSVISQRVVDQCGLQQIGVQQVCGVHGVKLSPTYLIALWLPHHTGFPIVRVTLGDLGNADLLIGMDIINSGDFAVTNEKGKTTFSFRSPSSETIDFVKPNPIIATPHHGRNDKCSCGSGRKYKNCCGDPARKVPT